MKDFLFSISAYAGKKLQQYFSYFSKMPQPIDPPPLHTFASLGNVPTVRQLLETQAVDVNETHSYHDKDPVTAVDVARQRGHTHIIEILMRHGAIDSYDLKLLGHSLGLQGSILLPGKTQHYPVNYEGFIEEDAYEVITHHLGLFYQGISQGNPHINVRLNEHEKRALCIASEAFNYYIKTLNDKFVSKKQSYLKGNPIIIKCAWPIHTGFALLYKDRLYISNKGGNTFFPGVSCYKINAQYLSSLSEVEFSELLHHLSATRASLFSANLSHKEFKKLSPQLLYYKRLPRQKNHNCTYSNLKRGLNVILQALMDDEELNFVGNIDHEKVYSAFTQFDRLINIDHYIEKYKASNHPQKWAPFFTYLREKSALQSVTTKRICAYIVKRLKSAPIGLKEDDILRQMDGLTYCRSLFNLVYTLTSRLEDVVFEKGKRQENIGKVLCHLPFFKASKRSCALVEAGIEFKSHGLKLHSHNNAQSL